MKKIIIGSFFFLTGIVSTSILLGATLFKELPVVFYSGGTQVQTSFLNVLVNHKLLPALFIYLAIAVAGVGFCIWGLCEKKD